MVCTGCCRGCAGLAGRLAAVLNHFAFTQVGLGRTAA
jgi:hypothetical protein